MQMTDRIILPERLRLDRATFEMRSQPDYRNLYGRSIIDVLAEKAIKSSKSLAKDPAIQLGFVASVGTNLLIDGFKNENTLQASIGGAILGGLVTRLFRR